MHFLILNFWFKNFEFFLFRSFRKLKKICSIRAEKAACPDLEISIPSWCYQLSVIAALCRPRKFEFQSCRALRPERRVAWPRNLDEIEFGKLLREVPLKLARDANPGPSLHRWARPISRRSSFVAEPEFKYFVLFSDDGRFSPVRTCTSFAQTAQPQFAISQILHFWFRKP